MQKFHPKEIRQVFMTESLLAFMEIKKAPWQ